ncbi:hypothetical protein HPB51_025974 [Rhipicephalus microplus]|uniref:Uncharacterized protein n=1 Tax=Rhipicephalus microplus TaxID=6941 RepID=A0A9J6EDU1_RHIMP|nr:hypothetical protein HPB51_025974 [Rhipicephalus microplus]
MVRPLRVSIERRRPAAWKSSEASDAAARSVAAGSSACASVCQCGQSSLQWGRSVRDVSAQSWPSPGRAAGRTAWCPARGRRHRRLRSARLSSLLSAAGLAGSWYGSFGSHAAPMDLGPSLAEWTREQPLSILQLDPADRAVLRIAGEHRSAIFGLPPTRRRSSFPLVVVLCVPPLQFAARGDASAVRARRSEKASRATKTESIRASRGHDSMLAQCHPRTSDRAEFFKRAVSESVEPADRCGRCPHLTGVQQLLAAGQPYICLLLFYSIPCPSFEGYSAGCLARNAWAVVAIEARPKRELVHRSASASNTVT